MSSDQKLRLASWCFIVVGYRILVYELSCVGENGFHCNRSAWLDSTSFAIEKRRTNFGTRNSADTNPCELDLWCLQDDCHNTSAVLHLLWKLLDKCIDFDIRWNALEELNVCCNWSAYWKVSGAVDCCLVACCRDVLGNGLDILWAEGCSHCWWDVLELYELWNIVLEHGNCNAWHNSELAELFACVDLWDPLVKALESELVVSDYCLVLEQVEDLEKLLEWWDCLLNLLDSHLKCGMTPLRRPLKMRAHEKRPLIGWNDERMVGILTFFLAIFTWFRMVRVLLTSLMTLSLHWFPWGSCPG